MSSRDLDPAALRNWPLPAAPGDSDKEDRGQVLVVAGSREIAGAALLSATAALRAGAGKLAIATVSSMAPQLAMAVPEARVIGLPETPAGGLDVKGLPLLDSCVTQVSAVLIGPGLADAASSCHFVSALLAKLVHVPVVLDALAMDVVLHRECFDQPVLLTPHAGEMAHLTGQPKDAVVNDALAVAQQVADATRAVITLKGATTHVVSPGGLPWRHVAENPGLATSGSGDVLAGIIAGLAARGASLEQAAAWAVVLHALAGRQLVQRLGGLGFLARELLAEIPLAMRAI